MRRTGILLAALFFLAAARPPVEAELVSEMDAIQPGVTAVIGVRLKMSKGWHTYWMNPGDGGMATSVEWELPPGFTAGPLQWPYPHKFDTAGLVSYGYSGEVLLVSGIEAPRVLKTGPDARIKATVRWLACNKICLPGEAVLAMRLPVKEEAKPDPRWKKLFRKTRSEWPTELPENWKARALDEEGKLTLVLEPPRGVRFRKAEFFPEEKEVVDYAGPQAFEFKDGKAAFEIPKSRSFAADRLKGTVVFKKRAVRVDTPIIKGETHEA